MAREVRSVELPEATRRSLTRQLQSIPYTIDDIDPFLRSAFQICSQVSENVLSELLDFSCYASAPGILRIGNVPIDEALPSTPLDARRPAEKYGFVSEASLLGMGRLIGEPLGYRAEKYGELIQNVCPVESEARATSSESSAIELNFHTDLDYDENDPYRDWNVTNADYIVLLCLRQDPSSEAVTLYADARDLCRHLSSAELEFLRRPLFEFQATYTFTARRQEDRIWSAPLPVLKGPAEFPEITLETACGVRTVDPRADMALGAIVDACRRDDVQQRVRLRSGDLLLINNRKGVHARSPFHARFDGSDRWLQRLYVRRSLWELRSNSGDRSRMF